MESYEKMLEEAKKKLPDVSKEGTRLEVPVASMQIIGRQTVIKNFSAIVKAIRRDEKLLSKYLFKELAVPGMARQNELVLFGKIKDEIIQKRIDEFVKDFVICHECGKPDTTIEKSKKSEFIKCEACGAKRAMKKI